MCFSYIYKCYLGFFKVVWAIQGNGWGMLKQYCQTLSLMPSIHTYSEYMECGVLGTDWVVPTFIRIFTMYMNGCFLLKSIKLFQICYAYLQNLFSITFIV